MKTASIVTTDVLQRDLVSGEVATACLIFGARTTQTALNTVSTSASEHLGLMAESSNASQMLMNVMGSMMTKVATRNQSARKKVTTKFCMLNAFS
jgi:hypothetical protein